MTQELDLDAVVRARVRGLRTARGWSLDALAARCHLSPSTLSRIETGRRRVALDQLVLIARALGTTLDALVEPVGDEDVVIRPTPTHQPGAVSVAAVPAGDDAGGDGGQDAVDRAPCGTSRGCTPAGSGSPC